MPLILSKLFIIFTAVAGGGGGGDSRRWLVEITLLYPNDALWSLSRVTELCDFIISPPYLRNVVLPLCSGSSRLYPHGMAYFRFCVMLVPLPLPLPPFTHTPQCIVIGLIVGSLFYQLPPTVETSRQFFGSLFLNCMFTAMGQLPALPVHIAAKPCVCPRPVPRCAHVLPNPVTTLQLHTQL